MRKVLFCLLGWSMVLVGGVPVQAQIHQPSQRFVEAGGGLADGLPVRKMDHTGYWFRISLGKYGKKEGGWQMGLSYQLKYYRVAQQRLPVQQYFLEGTFSPKLFKTADRGFYLQVPLGLLIGYEQAEDREIGFNLSEGLVGFTGGLNAEWNLSDRTALIAYGRGNFLPSSLVQVFHFQYGIGMRFNYFKR